MSKEVSAMELQRKLGELLDGVYRNGDRLIIKRANKPLAAIVPIETYEQMLKQQEKNLSVLDKIWEKIPAVSEEEAQADIEEAIAEERAEKASKKSEPSC
jgi:prevent-host-death family protein